jgi:hypothetical protein
MQFDNKWDITSPMRKKKSEYENHKLSENNRYHKPNFQTKTSIKINQNENF